MSVAEKIKEHLLPKAKGINVMDVRVGLVYTAVQLENGKAGVAFNFHEHLSRRCNFFEGLHPLAGREAPDLLELLDSTDKIETAVALATANSLSNTMRSGLLKGDILEHLPIRPKDKVGMVGYFAPIFPRLKRRASAIMIFEQIKEKRDDLLPEALSATPVSFLSGVIVNRPQEILHIVSDGGGMRFFKDNIKKVNLPLTRATD